MLYLIDDKAKNQPVRLVLSGCSTILFCHFGSIKRIRQNYDIKEIVATSGGAVIGSLFARGFYDTKIERILKSIKLNELLDKNFIPFFNSGFGIYKGNLLLNKFKEYLDITFEEMYKRSEIKLTIIATELGNLKPIYYNYETSPNKKVYEAIRESMSIPVLFNFVNINNKIMVDGGILDNFASDFYKDNSLLNIGIRVKSSLDDYKQPKSFLEYILTIISMIMFRLEEKIVEDSEFTKILYIKSKFNALSFEHSQKDIEEMFSEGFDQTHEFLKTLK